MSAEKKQQRGLDPGRPRAWADGGGSAAMSPGPRVGSLDAIFENHTCLPPVETCQLACLTLRG